ncbi:fimbrillin family protein [Bacteroides helcogenes]|uniref:Fimbrillin family protein n=1 Tax=Bacteroides helcogenes (strain ATCC 35417 / DSM 20613 / JCM 6297 / CCUG 15421 / P 36-108) TaxID=693979 RepID=E6SP22_BACT6|nr:fimbrillin family protein [Bacteroides helcogenes]ADV43792.1 hypothetical protein Bache_1811 [Bacteroides helcogenes P 36-108]MDY5237422.1 fimbrillin family protein [Bacteroides helcogenes]
MRRNRQNIFMAAALLLLAGCGNDNETATPDGSDRVALQVTSGIQSRAIGSDWQAGDGIGIYMLKTGTSTITEAAENRLYTTAVDGSNGGFTATADQTIYFPVDGSDVDFIAYYPQQTLTDGSMTIDVSSQESLPKIDLMTAKVQSADSKKYNKSQPNVAFNFSHKLTKIELNITNGTGLTPSDLAELTVEITKQCTAATYTPLTETLALTTGDKKDVTLNTAADGTAAEAILLPNSDEFNPSTDRELVFTLDKTGEKFRWTISGEKDFIAGDRNIYNITINRSGLEVTATIENWNLGNGEKGENGSAE